MGEGQYDHLLHQTTDEQYLVVWLAGDTPDWAFIREYLAKNNYPYRLDPCLDEETIDLFVNNQVSRLDSDRKIFLESDEEPTS